MTQSGSIFQEKCDKKQNRRRILPQRQLKKDKNERGMSAFVLFVNFCVAILMVSADKQGSYN